MMSSILIPKRKPLSPRSCGEEKKFNKADNRADSNAFVVLGTRRPDFNPDHTPLPYGSFLSKEIKESQSKNTNI